MRREHLLKILEQVDKPIKGSQLAELLNVSRQVIVQDIALLRAEGMKIIATPQGYTKLQQDRVRQQSRIFACQHDNDQQLAEELAIIVDLGGVIKNVIVEHPIYGEIVANLNLSTREDVEQFLLSLKEHSAAPLSSLTNGIHLHCVEAKNLEILNAIEHRLTQKEYIVSQKER